MLRIGWAMSYELSASKLDLQGWILNPFPLSYQFMIFTYPAIFYALFLSDPVARPRENGNANSSKRGEKTESDKFDDIKNLNDHTQK